MIEQTLYLDMRKEPGRVPPRATVRRGEANTQKITAQLTMDGAAYTPTYSDARLRVLHEDGTWAVCSATKGTASVTATLPGNCLNGAGRCRLAYFEFSSTNGYAETTEGFELVILENVDGDGSDEAANYDDELLQLWNKWSAYEKQAEEQEEARVDAESARAKAEASRASAETSRASAEGERASAETARATAEASRASAETSRVEAERARVDDETSRAIAESARAADETSRASAEGERAAAETAREEACAEAIAAAETATAGAEKVNATLSGTVLIVTDRTGESTSVDTQRDLTELTGRVGDLESLVRADGTAVEVGRKADGSYTSSRLTVADGSVSTNGAAASVGGSQRSRPPCRAT